MATPRRTQAERREQTQANVLQSATQLFGAQGFRAFLAGAHAMDTHFRKAPLASNLPVRLALLDIWYRDFLHLPTRCVAPYGTRARRIPPRPRRSTTNSSSGC